MGREKYIQAARDGLWIIDDPWGKDYAYISVLVSNYGNNVWKEMRKIIYFSE